jgi:hypothetical protein
LKELGILPEFTLDGKRNTLEMEGTDHQFYLSVKASGKDIISINQEGLIKVLK